MSMPSFPPNGADMTREEALTMIIASIAMEELALSHILNAEGEKLQYILGTLPGTKPCAGPQEVLAVNKSVTSLVEAVTQNQMLLKNKLERVLELCPPEPGPPPCPPGPGSIPCPPGPGPCPPPRPARPCPGPPPCEKSALQLAGQREGALWNPGCRLPWRQKVRRGTGLCWDKQAPAQVRLNPQKTWAVQYTLDVCALHPAVEAGSILLKQTPRGAFTETAPLRFSLECGPEGPKTLQYTAVLYPCMAGGNEAELSLVLDAEAPLYVERAALDITEL
nr:hypothetical protein [uncultured Oscillibacter sp.]